MGSPDGQCVFYINKIINKHTVCICLPCFYNNYIMGQQIEVFSVRYSWTNTEGDNSTSRLVSQFSVSWKLLELKLKTKFLSAVKLCFVVYFHIDKDLPSRVAPVSNTWHVSFQSPLIDYKYVLGVSLQMETRSCQLAPAKDTHTFSVSFDNAREMNITLQFDIRWNQYTCRFMARKRFVISFYFFYIKV